jgi:hypothetical protein
MSVVTCNVRGEDQCDTGSSWSRIAATSIDPEKLDGLIFSMLWNRDIKARCRTASLCQLAQLSTTTGAAFLDATVFGSRPAGIRGAVDFRCGRRRNRIGPREPLLKTMGSTVYQRTMSSTVQTTQVIPRIVRR